MTKTTHRWQKWVRLPLAAAVAAGMSAPASAFQFYLGDLEGAFDTTLSAGAIWRAQERDKRLISQGNLGLNGNGVPIYAGTTTGASSNNYDDGNLNFENDKTVSKIVKGTSELYLNYPVYGDYLTRVGGFVRGRYWYDFELKDEKRAMDPSGQRRQLNEEADANASGAEFLDAYVWTDWYFGSTPVSLRYGKQVVSWGESTFIQGGINVINPVDVQAIRAPGAELKEALLPVEMFYTSIGLTESVTLEAFAQMGWEKVRPDDCGTFFSTNDFAADGCGPVLLAGQLPDFQAEAQGLVAQREGDREPDDGDQFGAALRWYVPALNDSELGFYYIRYHSRLPYVSGRVNDPNNGVNLPNYFIEYPEGIDLYGLSINTNLPGGYSLGAEYSFRPNMPIQWNAFELINGGIQRPYSKLYQQEVQKRIDNGATEAQAIADLQGKAVDGYDRFKVSQLQATFIKFYEQVMGASRLSLVFEVGGTYVHDLPDKSEARYGRSGAFGMGEFSYTDPDTSVTTTCTSGSVANGDDVNINDSYCTNEGFVTPFSWGYVGRLVWDYDNAFAGVNLQPQIAFSHDVNGYAPEPGANFREGQKSIGLSVKGTYLNQYTASVGYTNFFGGKPYNELTDRDFFSASMSVSF
ncbi:DUF1302 domain-containing protein [Marinobacteraceae bacterium S3BR75-40.1]